MSIPTKNPVGETPAAAPDLAEEHFAALLTLETDCWDTHEAMSNGADDFVLVDVRGKDGFDAGHIAGAISIPHGRLIERNLAQYPMETLFVVYCAGPHCNGADKGALRLAKLGRPVKKMIGGLEGWIDEGFDLVGSNLATLERFGQAWADRDLKTLADCLSDDCWYSPSVASSVGETARGRSEVVATIEAMWVVDDGSEASFGEPIEKGDAIVRTWTYQFDDGRSELGIDVFTFANGLLVGKDAYRKAAQ